MIPVLGLAAFAFAAATAAAPDCDPARVRVSSPASPQGGVVLVEIDAEEAGEPAGTWQGKPVRFWREDEKGPWQALLGVDLESKPGEARLVLEKGLDGTCGVALSITAATFA